jgi:hypothetical protein
MKLITLAKRLDFTTEDQYFDYCRDSYINGNFSQCKELFKAMTKADRKALISYLQTTDENSIDFECYLYYFNLL